MLTGYPFSTADVHSPQSSFGLPPPTRSAGSLDSHRLEADDDVVAPQELAVAVAVVERLQAVAGPSSPAQSQRTSLRMVTFLLGFQFRPSVTSFHLEPCSMDASAEPTWVTTAPSRSSKYS